MNADVAVIGGGPAGLAAATELKRLGAGAVVLLEREAVLGGIPRHCGHSPFGMREFGRILGGGDYTARLAERAASAGVDIQLRTSVVAIKPEAVDAATPDGLLAFATRRILIATGTRETSRAGRLLPGQRPVGIVTAGALQDYVYLRHLVPFRRPVIVGSELVTMSSLLTCRHAGIHPAALVEDEPGPRIGWPIAMFPTLLGTPSYYRTTIDDIFGTARVEAVRLRHADGTTRDIECDGVLLTGHFTPESSLARLAGLAIDPATGGPAVDASGRTSRPDIFAAGNVRHRVRTAGHCWSEGVRTARAVAASLEST
jgi:thioredoxin reductase